MPILENDVKKSMEAWLISNGYSSVQARLGTRQGYDVEGIDPTTKHLLVLECKGEAQTGDQHSRSWGNVASALLTSLNETEDPSNNHHVGIALPDTKEYRGRMHLLERFCKKQQISVFWVSENGVVAQW